jgi:hypothetical protein
MAETAAAGGGGETAPLDDIMMAMDVVDTLRHREHVIDREMGEDEREAALVGRLKSIYAAQGIEVPERILKEGVQGLKERRFVYEPAPAGLETALARLYVARWRWGRMAGAVALALVVIWAGYTFGYRLPAERAAEQARIELSHEFPDRLRSLAEEVAGLAEVAEARARAEALRDEGASAASAGDHAGAAAAIDRLEALHADLAREYVIRIVQGEGEGEQSGVWRIPDANPDARNYYLIVEAVTGDADPLALAIRREETGRVETVTRWGQRVSESAFERVRRDKADDGIIQNDVIGEKRSGYLDPEFSFPVEDGAITGW